MTHDEANAVLDVPRDASPEVIRRAYLALVHKHKPESDPEGFRRIRDAYECLRRAPRPAVVVLTGPAYETSNDAPFTPTQDASSDGRLPSAIVADLLPYWKELDAAEARHVDPSELIAIATRAVDRFPESADALWMLVETSMNVGDRNVAAQTLRRGADAGHPGFLDALAIDANELLRDDEIEAFARGSSSASRMHAAFAWIRRDRIEDASGVAMAVLEAAIRGEIDVHAPRDFIIFGTALFAAGRVDLAMRYACALFAALPSIANLHEMHAVAAEHVHLRELTDVAPTIDPEVTAILARVVLRMSAIENELYDFEMLRGLDARLSLREASQALKKDAPVLSARFSSRFESAGRVTTERPEWTPMYIIAGIGALALLARMLSPATHDYSSFQVPEVEPPTAHERQIDEILALMRTARSSADEPKLEDMVARVVPFCADSASAACEHASLLSVHVENARCDGARAELEALSVVLDVPLTPAVDGSRPAYPIDEMSALVLERCGPPPEEEASP